jgi:hypothetical protein
VTTSLRPSSAGGETSGKFREATVAQESEMGRESVSRTSIGLPAATAAAERVLDQRS